MTFTFGFDHPHDGDARSLAPLLGARVAELARMTTTLGLPVPPGFVLTTDAWRSYTEDDSTLETIEAEVRSRLEALAEQTGSALGSTSRPLLVAVSPSPPVAMPGALTSILNVGLNDHTVQALAATTGDDHFAWDTYRRFVEQFGTVVLGVPAERFEHRLEGAKLLAGADEPLSVEALQRVVERDLSMVADHTGTPFPQDPADQVRAAVFACLADWDAPAALNYRNRERVPHDIGMAVSVQQMVFGNRDERSGAGLVFSRDPTTGERGARGVYLTGGQGRDVGLDEDAESLAGLAEAVPGAHDQLMSALDQLEADYGDMVSVEFTVESGTLWLLDAAPGDRSGRAAVNIAVDLTDPDDLGLSRADALLRVSEDHLDQLLHPQMASSERTPIAVGLGASPGAAVGRVYFTPDDAEAAWDQGDDVILVKNETSPEDVHGMSIAEGILTTKGGLASHAAVVARGWGKPAVCGAEAIVIGVDRFTVGDVVVVEGDVISLDGATGEVFLGAADLAEAETPAAMTKVLEWADEIRAGRLAVRANADSAEDARRAREFGAEGIGLCRTEHQFLGDRLPIVQRMILASDPDEEQAALEVLGDVQRGDFVALFEAMDGLPVTVRLLDPPLHEFLPDIESLAVADAKGELDAAGRVLLDAARLLHEENPMLGTRGVRLGILRSGLFRMQARAVAQAFVERKAAGGQPIVEIMVPLVINRSELDLVRGWIEEELAEQLGDGDEGAITIGTMIETPRAALVAGAIAESADFFSFGTNDLTQMTLGFSRDDVEGRIMKEYIERGLLGSNPFETIDRLGVGELVRRAAQDGRASRPGLKLGVCGEHGGDPRSIQVFWEAGLDYVSCSPFRVPIARLAAAQAIVRADTASSSYLGG